MNAIPNQVLKEAEVVGALERICQAMELTLTQHQLAKDRYEAVGNWLANADNSVLRTLVIYPHGSVALGTTVKPHGKNEHDVDLVSHVRGAVVDSPPAALKSAIGNRLREHGHYSSILEEKRRCWRLNYANEFHLDITPSILNPTCANGGELVPDKELQRWKPTNPKGYKALFDRRAALRPRLRFAKAFAEDRAGIEPFPEQSALKGILRRTVQLSKRHRDIHFDRVGSELAPISVILTTLAARGYEHCVTHNIYSTELQLLIDVIRMMPQFIETQTIAGRTRWTVWNETTAGENFAEKWNINSALAPAFFAWHTQFLHYIERITDISGLDQLTKSLTEAFGPRPVTKAMRAWTDSVSAARASGRLSVAPKVGLSVGTGLGTIVRANTFFGAD